MPSVAAQLISPLPPEGDITTSEAPFTTPDTADCPFAQWPPPASDTSDEPRPGEPEPTPLPIPSPPVGGPLLGQCDLTIAPNAPAPPEEISAASWLIADLDSGEILATKDPHGRHRPASTIKTLLALVAFDELDLDKTVFGTMEDANIEGSRAGIGPRGEYTNRLLMQALVLASGNDVANAIATQLGGIDETLRKMNERAKELGALDTRAGSPSGLDSPGMSSSAYDLAVIFREAMNIPEFVENIQTTQVDFPGYPADPEIPGDFDRPGFAMGNDNIVNWNYPDSIGGKNGFTNSARQTYVGAAERDGRRLVVSVLMADNEPQPVWKQIADLFDYGFSVPPDDSVGTLNAIDSIRDGAAESDADVLAQPGIPRSSSPGPESDTSATQRFVVGAVGGIVVLALLLAAVRVGRKK
ncbi:putative penicillin-binding protein DacB1 [Hoyosella rhizosphaerae]|uniref:Penicillin-binding protein DacB1 n=2 Tax=Hoyosella rhizosphaerae TaxID=1755582 RepID=A0A916XEY0_9ACTN|nr:putative penicillin-binding protein DacB1 [Hoyosella rhizosphaerae]